MIFTGQFGIILDKMAMRLQHSKEIIEDRFVGNEARGAERELIHWDYRFQCLLSYLKSRVSI